MINNNFISSKCFRCNEEEDQNHIARFKAVDEIRDRFIAAFKETAAKEAKLTQWKEGVIIIINCIKKCLGIGEQ